MPALFTNISGSPIVSFVCFFKFSMLSSLDTSVSIENALLPNFVPVHQLKFCFDPQLLP